MKSTFCILLSLALAISACAPRAAKATLSPSDVLADSFFSGQAFVDANNNGKVDDADTPLQGATLIARDGRGAEFGATTNAQGRAFVTIPGGSQYPVTLRMQPPRDNPLPLIGPAEVVLQAPTGDNIQFLFSSP